jgi:hypothetical protein
MNLEQIIRVLEERVLGRFLGKYGGVVTDVDDPLQLGRLRAKVPAVLGEDVETGWALPCAPSGGGRNHGLLFVPPVGATVWLEFLDGDVTRPVWSGAFWGAPESAGQQDDLGEATGTEVPEADGQPGGPGRFVLRTPAGHRLVCDEDGGVVILAHGNDKAVIRLTSGGEVILSADKVLLGGAGASEPVVLGEAFRTLFNSHTHPTGVGPSGPPTPLMTPGQLSSKTKTE